MKRTVVFIVILPTILGVLSCESPRSLMPTAPQDRHTPYNYLAKKAMVVAAHPLAAEAGLEILKRGGNAVDAAVATAVALNVTEPFASGIGGGGFMVIYLQKTKKVTVINFREKAPAASTPTMFAEKGDKMDEWRQERGTAVGVPGMLAGWNYALKKYGTKTLSQVASPSIAISEKGYPVSATFSQINKDEYEKIRKNGGDGSIYLNSGIPYEPGHVFKNHALAATLRTISTKGIDEFYKGEIATKIVAAVRAKGGIMTGEDLASYQPVEVEPLKGTYRGYTIYTPPPPGTGGLHMIQLLNVAEGWPLEEWGHNTPDYIHHLSEAMRFIFADKDRYDGDPMFVSIPATSLLSKEYAKEIREKISPGKTAGFYTYGRFGSEDSIPRVLSSARPPCFPFWASSPGTNRASSFGTSVNLFEGHQQADRFFQHRERIGNTTHVGVVDASGNIVALTQSINDFFGTGIVPEGTGFLLNDHMADFSADPNSSNAPRPCRQPVSNMGPMIAFKDGEPVLVLGSPGGARIFPSLSQIIFNVFDFGMSLDGAIEAARFFTYSLEGKAQAISVEPRIPEGTLRALEKLRNEITLKEPYDRYFGGAQGILIAKGKKIIFGAADSRRDGIGAGY